MATLGLQPSTLVACQHCCRDAVQDRDYYAHGLVVTFATTENYGIHTMHNHHTSVLNKGYQTTARGPTEATGAISISLHQPLINNMMKL